MSRMIFVNLPVTDLKRSMAFYEAVGATNEPKFTNDAAAMMRFSEEVNVMLLTHDFWRTFTTKQIPDAHQSAQVLLCLSADSPAAVDAQIEAAFCISAESREEVDELVTKELALGGSPAGEKLDQGFMYGWSFQDLDGHIWEPMWMDPAVLEQSPS